MPSEPVFRRHILYGINGGTCCRRNHRKPHKPPGIGFSVPYKAGSGMLCAPFCFRAIPARCLAIGTTRHGVPNISCIRGAASACLPCGYVWYGGGRVLTYRQRQLSIPVPILQTTVWQASFWQIWRSFQFVIPSSIGWKDGTGKLSAVSDSFSRQNLPFDMRIQITH